VKHFDFSGLLHKHQDPPRISFYIFSRFVSIGDSIVTKPAGMFGAIDLDQALEAATRSIAAAEGNEDKSRPILLRLDFVLPSPDFQPVEKP
jgi:hypothetical protein